MNPLALRWRLTIPVALVLAVALAVVCAVAYHSFQELVISRADRSLMSAGEAIRSTVDNPLLAADRPAQIRRLLDALGQLVRGPQRLVAIYRDVQINKVVRPRMANPHRVTIEHAADPRDGGFDLVSYPRR